MGIVSLMSLQGCSDDATTGDTNTGGTTGGTAGSGGTSGGTAGSGGSSAGSGGTAGSGGKGGSAGSQASGGEGGDTTSGGSGGKGGTGGTTATGGAGGESGSGTGGSAGEGGIIDIGGGSGGEGGGGNDCSVEADYGDAGSVPGTATTVYAADLSWYGPLEAGNPADSLWVELYEGAGIFENGLTTISNYTLAGDDLVAADCNACIYITDRWDTGDETWIDTYFVTGGVLNLTSVEGNITGTVTNATFKKLDWDTGEFIEDGCLSAIDSISFNAPIPAP